MAVFRATTMMAVVALLVAATLAWFGFVITAAAAATSALLLAGIGIWLGRRSAPAANADAIIEHAMSAMAHLKSSAQSSTKPLTAWVVAEGHVRRLTELANRMDGAKREALVGHLAAMAEQTFKGPKGRRHVTNSVVARILDVYEAAAPLAGADARLAATLEEHLWVDASPEDNLVRVVQTMRGGLRDDETKKTFDPPVFKRRVQTR